MPIEKSVRYFVNGVERPGSHVLQAGSTVYAEETATDSRGNVRMFRTNTVTVAAASSTAPAGYTSILDYRIAWDGPGDFAGHDIYLPTWQQGPRSIGDPSRITRNADKSVTLTGGEGPAVDYGGGDVRTWRSGSLQIIRPAIAGNSAFGALVHVTKPRAVAAVFGYDRTSEKEVDFELTRVNGVIGWAPNLWLYHNGRRVNAGGGRAKTRAPWADRPQLLESRMDANSCRFYCDGVLFETITPADFVAGVPWNITSTMQNFIILEKHDSWAGWTQTDYNLGAEMIVYAARPGPSPSTTTPTAEPPPSTPTGTVPTEITASRVVQGFPGAVTAARTITHPAATAGRLQVLYVAVDKATAANVVQDGWTLRQGHDTGPGCGGFIFTRRATGGETSVSFTTTAAFTATAIYMEWNGVSATTPVATAPESINNTGTPARTTGEIDAGVSTVANQLAIAFASNDSQNNAQAGTSGGWSDGFTEIAGYQRPGTGTALGTFEPFLSVATKLFPTVGAARKTAYTYLGGTADEIIGMMLVLNPA